MIYDEQKLNSELKKGQARNIYYLYGKEPFLTRTYREKIIKTFIPESDRDLNLVKFENNINLNTVIDNMQSLPIFAEKKLILLNDFFPDRTDQKEFDLFLECISEIPESTILLITTISGECDKRKSQVKNLIKAAEKHGAAVQFEQMTIGKIIGLIKRKFQKNGIIISDENANYLAELTLSDITLISNETDKLISYVGKGEVKKADIDLLVTRQLDTSIFTLVDAITEKNTSKAFGILSDLFSQQISGVAVLGALSSTYTDLYRAKAAMNENISQGSVANDFLYAKNRIFLIGKAFNSVRKMRIENLRKSIDLLMNADFKLKSSPVSEKIVMEELIVRLLCVK